jgi:protein-disulfide isomerase
MNGKHHLTWLGCLWLALASAGAEMVNYQGRLVVDGTPFHGAGQFRFAIVGGDGTVLWSTKDVDLLVRNGVYTARLGDAAAGMAPLPAGSLSGAPLLRVWFNDRKRGWQQAGGDVPLAGAAAKVAEESSMTGAQAAAILAELREIRAMLAKQQAPPTDAPPQQQRVTVSLRGAPSLGQADAPLVMVEFNDFQSPACRQFHFAVFPAVMSNYIDTGKVRLVSRNLPQHPHSEAAARAGLCAQKQGKYWELREKLFDLGSGLAPELISKAARDAGLDMKAFALCYAGAEPRDALKADADDAKAAGITETPAFVIGRQDGDKVTGLLMVGVVSIESFEKEILQLLSRPAAGAP